MIFNQSHVGGLDKSPDLFPMNGAGNNEGGPLHLLDGIDVLLDDGIDDGLVEAMGGSHHDVQAGAVDVQGARAGEGVQEVEALGLFIVLIIWMKELVGGFSSH